MKLLLLLLTLVTYNMSSQDGFYLESNKKRQAIPFTLINNLIFIKVTVNSVPMVFLLDTGVEETLFFSVEDVAEINFKNTEKVRLKGLGIADYVEGFKSSGNSMVVGKDFRDDHHDIYIIMDQDFNISSGLGIPVNGIIGAQFFKNHIIEINYSNQHIYIYKELKNINTGKLKNYQKFNITIERNKPYIQAEILLDTKAIDSKLLLDLGNSDAIWLFQNQIDSTLIPKNYFEDYLGRGFSGEIHGKRAKLKKLRFDKFEFKEPYVAFPDTLSIRNVKVVQDRIGSLGGEIFKRFTVILDYKNHTLYLKPNALYDTPFNFNMSGIEIHHEGLQWIQEKVELHSNDNREGTTVFTDEFSYKFELKPVFKIYSLRLNSPAILAGLQKGDELISINKRKAYHFTLQEIYNIFKSEEGKKIVLEVKRNNTVLKYTFYLKSIL